MVKPTAGTEEQLAITRERNREACRRKRDRDRIFKKENGHKPPKRITTNQMIAACMLKNAVPTDQEESQLPLHRKQPVSAEAKAHSSAIVVNNGHKNIDALMDTDETEDSLYTVADRNNYAEIIRDGNQIENILEPAAADTIGDNHSEEYFHESELLEAAASDIAISDIIRNNCPTATATFGENNTSILDNDSEPDKSCYVGTSKELEDSITQKEHPLAAATNTIDNNQAEEYFHESELFDAAGSDIANSDIVRSYCPTVTTTFSSTSHPNQSEPDTSCDIVKPKELEDCTNRKEKPLAPALRACHQYAQKHNLTDAAALDFLRILEKVRGEEIPIRPGDIPKKLKTYQKRLGGLNAIRVAVQWKCKFCGRKQKADFQKGLGSLHCCGILAKHTDTHLFTICLRDILRRTLPAMFHLIRKSELKFEGLMKIQEKVAAEEDDVFIAVNTDGVAISKSSNKSLWPTLVSVLGTPQHLRKDQTNMMMQSLWVSSTEIPDVNWILESIVYELMELQLEPLIWQDNNGQSHSTRVFLGYICTDSMARFKVSGLHMHNAKYGCTYCTHEESGHYFTYTKENPERSHEDYLAAYSRQTENSLIEQGLMEPKRSNNPDFLQKQLLESQKYSLKYRSIVCDLHYFDIIWGLPVDSLHTVNHGVFRLLINSLVFPSPRIKSTAATDEQEAATCSHTQDTEPYFPIENQLDGFGDVVWEDQDMREYANSTQQKRSSDLLPGDTLPVTGNPTTKKANSSVTIPMRKSDRAKVDAFISRIQPPKSFVRKPRPLTDRAHFKAHEWAAAALVYLPVIFSELLPKIVFDLYVQLLRAVEILSLQGRTETEILEAEHCIDTFTCGISKYFTDGAVNYNIHLLKHLPRCYRLYGPMYLYSLRYFENFNKRIVGFTSTNQFTAVHAVRRYVNSVVDPPDNNLFTIRNHKSLTVTISGTTYILSGSLPREPGETDSCTLYRNVLLVAKDRTITVTALPKDPQSVRHNSSCFLLSDGSVAEVKQIQYDPSMNVITLLVENFQVTPWQKCLSYILINETASNQISILPALITELVVKISHGSKVYFFQLLNSVDLTNE